MAELENVIKKYVIYTWHPSVWMLLFWVTCTYMDLNLSNVFTIHSLSQQCKQSMILQLEEMIKNDFRHDQNCVLCREQLMANKYWWIWKY